MKVFLKTKKSFVTRSRAKTYLSDDTNGVSLKKWIGKCIPISEGSGPKKTGSGRARALKVGLGPGPGLSPSLKAGLRAGPGLGPLPT